MIRHQFGQVEFASEHWFRLAATTLASVTRAAGLATPAKPRDAHIRRIDLVAINERMASLILVLREGAIKQALVTLDERRRHRPADAQRGRGAAQRAPRRHDRHAGPRPGSPPSTTTTASTPSPGGSASGSSRSCASTTPTAIEEVFSDGLLNVMEAPGVRPERQAPARLHRPREPGLPRRARRQRRRRRAVSRSSSAHENQPLEMRDVSLVLAPYGRPGPGDRRRRRPRARRGCPTPRRSARSASCPAS